MVNITKLFQLIAENTTDLVCLHDSHNTIRYATPSSKIILGHESDKLVGKKLTDFLSKEFIDEMDFLTLQRFFDNPGARIRFQIKHADGRLRWLETTFNVVNTDQLTNYSALSSTRDITESVHLTEDLMQALSREQEVSNFKSNLYSVASHEFKTPLAVIQASIEMLKVKKSEKLLEQSLESMEEEIDKLNTMIADMLQLKKLATNETSFSPEELELEMLLEELINSDICKAYPNNEVLIDAEGNNGCTVYADYSLLRYVFSNIISNACKYSGKNSTVQVTVTSNREECICNVTDQGIGIPEKDQNAIFTAFYRASNTSKISGTGVGLSIVKEFVEKHKGRISFKSKVNVGTTFTVTLPTHNYK